MVVPQAWHPVESQEVQAAAKLKHFWVGWHQESEQVPVQVPSMFFYFVREIKCNNWVKRSPDTSWTEPNKFIQNEL
ncbi:unnamed protein product [Blepharisma stoltei]|uniref:Uncharacterized protein n=1 Tax=Blepharisma stoltei TaxID=1481888 RepID=A0AAU9J1J4_9CILI|nr:unnamed protein product [Blepharisma stoltei]